MYGMDELIAKDNFFNSVQLSQNVKLAKQSHPLCPETGLQFPVVFLVKLSSYNKVELQEDIP